MKIDLKEEWNAKSYKETMEMDIENIDIFGKRNKVYTNQLRKIYEVIEPEFFEISVFFPEDLKIVRIMQMKLLIYQLR